MTKTIEIFAGPNGSGKTTFGELVLLKKNLQRRNQNDTIILDKIISQKDRVKNQELRLNRKNDTR